MTTVHVVKSVTIPTGRYKSARIEYGLTTTIHDGATKTQIRAEFRRVRKLIDAEMRQERRKIEEDRDD